MNPLCRLKRRKNGIHQFLLVRRREIVCAFDWRLAVRTILNGYAFPIGKRNNIAASRCGAFCHTFDRYGCAILTTALLPGIDIS